MRISGGRMGSKRSSASLDRLQLATHPSPCCGDRLPWPLITGPSILKLCKHALRAVGRPQSERMMLGKRS
jgi:hypothetical protein